MASNDELNSTQWIALIAFLLCLLVPLAVGLAVWIKRRYARAVVDLQAKTAVSHTVLPTEPHGAPTTDLPLATADLQQSWCAADAFQPAGADDPTRPARRLRAWVLWIQFVSGLLYWWLLLIILVFGIALLSTMTGQKFGDSAPLATWITQLVLWPMLVLPAALPWAFQACVRESRVWAVFALVMLCLGLGLVFAGLGWLGSGIFLLCAVLLALTLVTFMRPAVRGAGPPLVAAFTVGLLVFCTLIWVLVLFDDSPDTEPTLQDWLLAGGTSVVLLGIAAYGSWRMLMRLARRYTERKFSEQQLALGAYWALVTSFMATVVLMMSFEQRTQHSMEWLGTAILVSWLLWRVVQRVALRWTIRRAPQPLGALLLLRVFKPSERSEAFTDRFLARWRFAGPVWMIAGPDLAGAYLEPDEFFAYLQRSLHQRFITDADKLKQALLTLDQTRDPDGRCRVHELFCANTSWQATVLSLIDQAAVVMLDLREYNDQRAGTRFELEALLRRAPLEKVLVVVGKDDDSQHIGQEITAIWQDMAGQRQETNTPNSLQVLSVGEGTDAEMRGLFCAAAQAARGQGV
ncbi:hypothetical protein [Rhodoferax sp. BLA1]|uniref:hypothetical protein n=1 Tax=Rhodoferax sp. BLA1 TaxID=2576062 RepID=UPI0015D29104|nr:hypothetical protein [Rhodoferax sp. BLA1]